MSLRVERSELNIPRRIPDVMKFLYCPRCKDLHVKNWYAISDKCSRCFGNATAIKIPNNWLMYFLYFMYVLTPGLVLVYLAEHDKTYLYASVVALAIMMIVSYVALVRGEEYAKTKVRVGSSNVDMFRKKGWS